MSTNIESILVASGRLQIQAGTVHAIIDTKSLPEDSFIQDLEDAHKRTSNDEWLVIEELNWSGEGSGHSFDLFVEVLKQTSGPLDLMIFWEGGGFQGLRVTDGVVTKCRVGFLLEPIEGALL